MNILLVAATQAEIAPLTEWLGQDPSRRERVRVLITGLGTMATTYALTHALASRKADFVIGAGIAGAFDQSIALGECVVVRSEQAGDLGAEDRDDFIDVFSLGFQQEDEPPFSNGRLLNPLQDIPFDISGLRQVSGLTVNTVSGSAPTIASRSARYGAQIESMEGAALHYVCLQYGVPFIQLRAISNYVTPRDRSAWKTGDAFAALNAQLTDWLKR